MDDQADALVNGVFAFVAAIAPVYVHPSHERTLALYSPCPAVPSVARRRNSYQRIAVEGGEGADDDGYDSEGEVTGLDMLVRPLLVCGDAITLTVQARVRACLCACVQATEAVSVVGAIVAVESDVFRKLVRRRHLRSVCCLQCGSGRDG